MSRHRCLAVCCLVCQYFQCFSWSSLHFSSPNTTITTLWKFYIKYYIIIISHTQWQCNTCRIFILWLLLTNISCYCCRFIFVVISYPDFGDGMLDAFIVNLPESDWVKLTLVEVCHCPVTCFLTQRLGRLKSVLEIISKIWKNEGRI